MVNDRIIYRDYNILESISSSHNIGQKKVLLANVETISNITQLAITKLAAGDIVEEMFIRLWMNIILLYRVKAVCR